MLMVLLPITCFHCQDMEMGVKSTVMHDLEIGLFINRYSLIYQYNPLSINSTIHYSKFTRKTNIKYSLQHL